MKPRDQEIRDAVRTFLARWDQVARSDARSLDIPVDVTHVLTTIEHLAVAEIDGVYVQRGPPNPGGFRVLSDACWAYRPWTGRNRSIGFFRVAGRVLAARLARDLRRPTCPR